MMIETKLPKVGTTIFSVMSQLALEHKAVNLGQGFPDFEPPQGLRDALTRAMNEGRNQYAPMHGTAALREQIVLKIAQLYGRKLNVDTDITVTSGATEAIFAAIAAVVILPSLLTLPFLARGLNAFTLGEAAAFHMGVPVERFKRVAILMVAAATGVSVALSGGIGFIGMIVPHLIRIAAGPDHRFLLPASALLGGCLLLAADMVTRVIVAPAELPIGIVTAVAGAPFFLWILLRKRGVIDL